MSPTRTQANPPRCVCWIVLFGSAVGLAGCVERTVTINTEPAGATVILNDQEVGQSPVKVPFTWYGDYDIILRKPGYETIQTNRKIKAPWYQTPFIDLFAECLVPFTIYDERDLGTFALSPIAPVPQDQLLQNAAELKQRALANVE
ncbi:MAG: PEGA domain-containing protein [Planctomycetia bacterium]|nr:MAG: PEGA domain-containing protein [Planctomycetia bacterium]